MNTTSPVDKLLIYKEIILAIVEKHLLHCTVYLFGSRARQTNKEGADIDIALDTGSSIAYEIMAAIRSDLEDSTLPVFVDLVDLNTQHTMQSIY